METSVRALGVQTKINKEINTMLLMIERRNYDLCRLSNKHQKTVSYQHIKIYQQMHARRGKTAQTKDANRFKI